MIDHLPSWSSGCPGLRRRRRSTERWTDRESRCRPPTTPTWIATAKSLPRPPPCQGAVQKLRNMKFWRNPQDTKVFCQAGSQLSESSGFLYTLHLLLLSLTPPRTGRPGRVGGRVYWVSPTNTTPTFPFSFKVASKLSPFMATYKSLLSPQWVLSAAPFPNHTVTPKENMEKRPRKSSYCPRIFYKHFSSTSTPPRTISSCKTLLSSDIQIFTKLK